MVHIRLGFCWHYFRYRYRSGDFSVSIHSELLITKFTIEQETKFDFMLFPKQFVIYITAALLVVQFFVLDTLLVGVAFAFVFITWRRLASAVNKQRYGMQLSDSTLAQHLSRLF